MAMTAPRKVPIRVTSAVLNFVCPCGERRPIFLRGRETFHCGGCGELYRVWIMVRKEAPPDAR